MPLARTFDAARGKIVITLAAGYQDRLSRDSDIREYMPFLYEQARTRPGCQVLELGTRKGNSTLAFLAGVKESGGHVWSCDVTDCPRDPEGMAPWARVPQWTFTRGDDMDGTVQSLLPARCDVLFIDTSHEYGHTAAELRAYMPRVAAGGVALFHDTQIFGDWSGKSDTVPPVARALDEYCAETGLAWENLPGDCGLGVIRL